MFFHSCTNDCNNRSCLLCMLPASIIGSSFKNTTSSYFQHNFINIKTILASVPWLLTVILISKCSSTTHWFTSIGYISDAYDFVWSTRNFYLVHTRASISIFCVVLFSAQEISCRKKKKTRVINLSER